MSFRRTAVLAALLAGAVAASPAPSQAGTKQDCKKQKKSKKCPSSVKQGRMTGHGQEFNVNGWDKVQWEFRNSVCNDNRFPDLKIEFGANKFVLTQYTGAGLICLDLHPGAEGHPVAGFDTIRGTGTGTLNGVKNYSISFQFSDAGEPGRSDLADFTIIDPNGNIVYSGGALDGGNHQAHRK
jgi:hypothetical protein